MNYSTRMLTAAVLAIGISACGGGGGGGGGGGTPPATPIGNVAGTWTITETGKTASHPNCQPPSSPLEVFNLTVAQNGNSLTVTDQQANVFNGTISGNTASWTGSYPDGPGTTTISSLSATIAASCNTLSGTANWTYAETGFSCTGTTTFTGTRSPASGCGGGGGGGTVVNEQEPNDTPAQANVVPSLPATINGTVSNNSDFDAFRITISTPRTLTITMTGPANQDVDLGVYNLGLTLIDGSGNLGSNESVTVNLAAGDYYVVALPFSVSAPAPYTINVP